MSWLLVWLFWSLILSSGALIVKGYNIGNRSTDARYEYLAYFDLGIN